MITALDVRYPAPEGAGHRAPDLPLADGTTLYAHLRVPRAILLRRAGPGPGGPDLRGRKLETLDRDGPAVLVRPDGHVAWVEEAGELALQQALNRWC